MCLAKNVMAENSLEAIMINQETIGTKTSNMEKIMCYPNLMKRKDNRNVSKILSQLFIKQTAMYLSEISTHSMKFITDNKCGSVC